MTEDKDNSDNSPGSGGRGMVTLDDYQAASPLPGTTSMAAAVMRRPCARTTLEDGFRRCQFLNVAAEYPDRTYPVRAVIDDQRSWLFGVLRGLSADMGHPDPDHAARLLVLLHDGAFQSAELDGPKAVRETLCRAVDEVFPASSGT
ncbi:hypothetical protein AB0D11_44990 [Streptomyces monashensis]|uniref:hypothetical protein n=1 Tax=Streptomyces monashensis TaxID=1678012 RepID=UPI0033DC1B70